MFDLKTYYNNFALDNTAVSLTVIVWAMCIGLALGVIFYSFTRHSAGNLIKKLAGGGHNTAENAASLATLSVKITPLLKKSLRDGQPLRKYVVIANCEECTVERKKTAFDPVYRFFRGEDAPAKYDLSKALLYLPEESRHTAQARFETKGSPYITAIIFALLFLLCAVGISFCLPKLLELVDTMITAYKNL